MKMQKSNIAYNLTTLRQLNKFSQEEVAERIGVSRQAVAKWEAVTRFGIFSHFSVLSISAFFKHIPTVFSGFSQRRELLQLFAKHSFCE